MSRFQFVADHQHAFEVKRLCELVEVERSSFYAWKAAAPAREMRAATDAELADRIRRIHAEDNTIGAPRATAELNDGAAPRERVNHKRVARVMREHDIRGGRCLRPGAGDRVVLNHSGRVPGDGGVDAFVRRHRPGGCGVHRLYGAGLMRHLDAAGIDVLEVTAGDKVDRRKRGKDDTIDAEQAAHAAFARVRTVTRAHDGMVESLRALKIARKTAINSRRVALQMIQALIISAPEELRDQLRNMTRIQLVRTLAGWRPAQPPEHTGIFPRDRGGRRRTPPANSGGKPTVDPAPPGLIGATTDLAAALGGYWPGGEWAKPLILGKCPRPQVDRRGQRGRAP